MADSGSSWTGSPDPIKIGWLGSALDGPDGGYNKIHRMAFDEALEDRACSIVRSSSCSTRRTACRVARLAIPRMVSSTSSTKVASASRVRTAPTTRSSPLHWRTSSKIPLISWAGTERLAGDYCFRLGNGDCGGDAALCASPGLLATGIHACRGAQ